MYQKLKDLFTKNLAWKAFSILMASLLWFIVMNINNPTEVKTFSLPLDLYNLKELDTKNIAVLNKNELEQTRIEIKLKATRPILDELTKKISKADIKAYLDINAISNLVEIVSPFEMVTQVKTNLSNIAYPNNNFEIVSFLPASVNVNLDNIVTIPKKVYVKKIGALKNGYIASEPELSSEYIQVTGAKSIIDTVHSVYVEIDLSNQASSFNKDVIPVAYDKDGNIIENVSFNLNTVNVNVPIVGKGQIKINSPKLVGNLPKGYSLKKVSYSPEYIQVLLNSNNLKNLTSINLPNIDISNLTASKEFKFNINDILKNYITNVNVNKNSEVTVYIEIQKNGERTITINSSELNISGINDKFIDFPDTFDIKISGEEEYIKNMDLSQIKASIDLKNTPNGINKIPIQVSLPKNVELVSTPFIEVNINELNTEETPASSTETTEIITETTSIEEEIKIENKVLEESFSETTSS